MASFGVKTFGLVLTLSAVLTAVGGGCALTDLASLKFMYHKIDIPESRVHRDIPYRDGLGKENKKQRLDLYAPEGKNWPVLVFVHGGGWDSGDKGLKVTGDDIYGNIGRFFAAHGIGTAVISYRLLPDVPWQEQIKDVAGAVAWVHRHIATYGGNPKHLFLSGHSAGAQLAARVALDPAPLKAEGLSKGVVSGVIAVSGAGYQIDREGTLATQGARNDYFARRFRGDDETRAWANEVSILRFIDKSAPPFLIFYGTAEPLSLRQQSQLLEERLKANGAKPEIHVIPHRDHIQMVLTMSREKGETTTAMLKFIKK